MVEFTVPEVDYTRYTNRQLAAIPLAVLAVALLIIAGWFVMTGSPVNQGIAFTGGTEVQVAIDGPQGEAEQQIRAAFSAEPESIRSVPAQSVYVVTFQSETGSVGA